MHLPSLLSRERGRDSHAPCPAADGTIIGTQQKFKVFCNIELQGRVLNTNDTEVKGQKMDSLRQCVKVCTNYHNPLCEGVRFDPDGYCILLSEIDLKEKPHVENSDSAVGIMPEVEPTSDCGVLGDEMNTSVSGWDFGLRCGKVQAYNDLEQQFQPSFRHCMTACVGRAKCRAISFNPDQSLGFNNCYLKDGYEEESLFTRQDVDTAILMEVGSGDGTGATMETMAFSAPSSTVTISVPVPVGAPATTSASATSSTSTNASAEDSTAAAAATAPSSNAWIAAPVVGSVAAVTLIIGVFVLWKRRHRQRRGTTEPDSSFQNTTVAAAAAAAASFSPFSAFALGGKGARLPRGRRPGGAQKLADVDVEEEEEEDEEHAVSPVDSGTDHSRSSSRAEGNGGGGGGSKLPGGSERGLGTESRLGQIGTGTGTWARRENFGNRETVDDWKVVVSRGGVGPADARLKDG